MAIKIEPLREAFALANKLADDPDIDMEQRKNYRSGIERASDGFRPSGYGLDGVASSMQL